jgi:hypothetical protein
MDKDLCTRIVIESMFMKAKLVLIIVEVGDGFITLLNSFVCV